MVLCQRPDKIRLRQLESWLQAATPEAKDKIVGFIHHRLHERYLTPLQHVPRDYRSGFLMMASACLLIETLQAFHDGKNETGWGMSQKKFREFFEREKKFFPGLADHAKAFYKNIRCGILHQAETTGGWRVRLGGPMFDPGARSFHAASFLKALEDCLDDYIQKLRAAKLEDPLWLKAADKVGFICKNCRT